MEIREDNTAAETSGGEPEANTAVPPENGAENSRTDGENQAAEPVTAEANGDKVLTKRQRAARTALKWLLMNVGVLMMAASVFFFQVPNNFTVGGVGGISIILSMYLPLTQAQIMAIINVLLLILGMIILGKQCTLLTIFCSVMYTAEIYIFETFIPAEIVSAGNPLTDQTFLELAYAILLFGVGGALIFNCGASSGGTDIIALILKKYTRLNVGFALMLVDLVVVCVSFFTFDVTSALLSLMGLFAKAFLLDSVIENIGKTKYITIITTRPDEISQYILKVIKHGYTMYDAEGGYTGEKKKVMITICKRGEAVKLKMKVKEFDPGAFVIITDANEILGKGFGGTF